MVGVSPFFELSVYHMKYLTEKMVKNWNFQLDGEPMKIKTFYNTQKGGGECLRSAFPSGL